MTVESNLPSYSTEEIFAQALERLEAGEPLEAIVAAYPPALHPDLRELLTVVAATHHLQEAEIPRPVAPRQAANKRAFLQAAATMRVEMAAEAQATAVTQAAAVRQSATKPALAPSTWLANVRAGWHNLLGSVTLSPMQLAPLVIMLTVISLGTFGFVAVAQAAIPGDLIYPAKQWLRQQELNLAAPEDRPDIVKEIEDETALDVVKAKERAAAQQKPIQATQTLFFRGWEDGNLLIGSLIVEPAYQLNPPDPVTAAMEMPTTPAEGKLVTIRYQLVPAGNTPVSDAGVEDRQVVQGISLTVIEESIVVPTVTPAPCQATRPRGWVPLTVRAGDTLSEIAKRTGTDVVTLTRVNCLENPNRIQSGTRLFAPALATATPTPTPIPSLAATLTAVSTTVSTEVMTPTQTVEPDATATLSTTVGVTPTVGISATATLTPTTVVTETLITPTATLTTTVTSATPQPMPALTLTLTAMAVTPEATVAITTTMTAAPSSTPTPPPVTSVEPTATLTPASSGGDNTATATETVNSAGDGDDGGDDGGDGGGNTEQGEPNSGEPTAAAAFTPTPPSTTTRPTSETEGRSGDKGTATPTAINRSPLTTGG